MTDNGFIVILMVRRGKFRLKFGSIDVKWQFNPLEPKWEMIQIKSEWYKSFMTLWI